MSEENEIGSVFNMGFLEGLKVAKNAKAAQRMIPANVDIEALRDIAADIENGEYLYWGGESAQSNAELIRLVIGADRG